MSQFSTHDSPASPTLALWHRLAPASRLADHVTLTKPGITVMVVVTAFIGFFMAVLGAGTLWSPWTLLATLAGTGLSCMGASVFNQIYERDTDARMGRTSTRPLPDARLSLIEAWLSGVALSGLGVGLLWFGAHPLAAGLSAFTIASYALLYTPMKRRHHSSTIIGAVPGAMPPVIGAAAATGSIGLEAALLFAIMVVWQLPHFWAIGLLYRDEYAAAGLPILPVIDQGGRRTRRQILVTSAALLVLGVLPTLLGVTGALALIVAAACGGAFFALAVRLVRNPGRPQARTLFLASLAYLPIVLSVILFDQWWNRL